MTKRTGLSSGDLNLLQRSQKLHRKKLEIHVSNNITIQPLLYMQPGKSSTSESPKGRAKSCRDLHPCNIALAVSKGQRHPLAPQKTSVSFPPFLSTAVLLSSLPTLNNQGFSLQHQVSLLTCRGHKAGAQGSAAGGVSWPFPAWLGESQ